MRFLLTLFIAGSLQAQTFATATVAPAEALRGIPPTIRVEIRNSGAEPLRVPRYFIVQAVLPNGEEYVVPAGGEEGGLRVQTVPEEYADDPPLASGAKRVLHLPLGYSLHQPEIFADRHFFEPGTYSFQILLDDRQVVGSQRVLDPLIVAPPVKFTVIPGSLADVRVWEAIMQRTANRTLAWQGTRKVREIANELLPMAEDSGYRVHLVLARSADSNTEWILLLREAIAVAGDDNPFLRDYLQTALIAALEQASGEADFARKDLPLAARSLQSAKATLEEFRPRTEWGEKRAGQLRQLLRDAHERLHRERD